MAETRPKVKCPYCDGEYANAGMTAHVRHKHPAQYEEYKANRKAGVQSTPKPAPEKKETPVVETPPVPEPVPEPEPETPAPEPDTPAPTEQKNASFLGSVGAALRDW
jgi:hypothetical protein